MRSSAGNEATSADIWVESSRTSFEIVFMENPWLFVMRDYVAVTGWITVSFVTLWREN